MAHMVRTVYMYVRMVCMYGMYDMYMNVSFVFACLVFCTCTCYMCRLRIYDFNLSRIGYSLVSCALFCALIIYILSLPPSLPPPSPTHPYTNPTLSIISMT